MEHLILDQRTTKRRKFQIRLSTAILLMFTISALILLNLMEQRPTLISSFTQSFGGPTRVTVKQRAFFYGWPLKAVVGKREWTAQRNDEVWEVLSAPSEIVANESSIFGLSIAIDGLVAIGFIGIAYLVAKYFVSVKRNP